MTPEHTTNWQVGAWTVQPMLNRIDGPEGSLRTTPKALATLLCLAEHHEERNMHFCKIHCLSLCL